jgi:hypothetical protein
VPDKGSEARPFEGLEGRIEELFGGLLSPPEVSEDLDSNDWPVEGHRKKRNIKRQLLERVVGLGELDLKAEGGKPHRERNHNHVRLAVVSALLVGES